MKRTVCRVGFVAFVMITAAVPVHALVRDATYQAAIKERDEARRERDEARAKYEELLKKWIEEAKKANPELREAARRAQQEAVEAERRANQVQLDREADAVRYSKTLTFWKTGAALSTAAVALLAFVAGAVMGTRTRRDFRLQQTAAQPTSVGVPQEE